MKVRAKKKLFYDNHLIEAGEVFDVAEGVESENFEPVEKPAPKPEEPKPAPAVKAKGK